MSEQRYCMVGAGAQLGQEESGQGRTSPEEESE